MRVSVRPEPDAKIRQLPYLPAFQMRASAEPMAVVPIVAFPYPSSRNEDHRPKLKMLHQWRQSFREMPIPVIECYYELFSPRLQPTHQISKSTRRVIGRPKRKRRLQLVKYEYCRRRIFHDRIMLSVRRRHPKPLWPPAPEQPPAPATDQKADSPIPATSRLTPPQYRSPSPSTAGNCQ